MKRTLVLFLWFYCTYSQSVLMIPDDEPGSAASATFESKAQEVVLKDGRSGTACMSGACISILWLAGTDISGKTTWIKPDFYFNTEQWNCTTWAIAAAFRGKRVNGTVFASAPGGENTPPPAKGSYRIYGVCTDGTRIEKNWYTVDKPWDGVLPPVCRLSGPDVIDFGELKAISMPGKSKKAFYPISCNKKATANVTFVFATGESTEKIADDLTLALTVGAQDGATGQTYTAGKSPVQAELAVALKSGGTTPPGEYQASAVVKMTVE